MAWWDEGRQVFTVVHVLFGGRKRSKGGDLTRRRISIGATLSVSNDVSDSG
jgi:hypothetical protein